MCDIINKGHRHTKVNCGGKIRDCKMTKVKCGKGDSNIRKNVYNSIIEFYVIILEVILTFRQVSCI